ncbi:MAG: AmmeMemoRadiSam system protein A [Nitrospinae bacterium]|nr:AmmeMemoRadiSam system protein A [Nitrospinota bacterium]
METKEKKLLLQLARAIIGNKLIAEKVPDDLSVAIDRVPLFKENRGVFVTLHINNNLRGCIGYIEPYKPLLEAVIDNAISAAFRDTRFAPLTAEEFRQVDIEISVLTVPEIISSYDKFIVGRHGIILKKGRNQAVFLPQVAPEQGWNQETTLMYLSQKAGLAPDAWREGCEFKVFEAEHFSEKDLLTDEN